MDKQWQALCDIRTLKPGQSLGFENVISNYQNQSHSLDIFVVHVSGEVRVFRNRCPHLGIHLEWQPDQFLDINRHYIICSTHSALFRPSDGFCISGPCAGSALEAIPHKVEDGLISIDVSSL